MILGGLWIGSEYYVTHFMMVRDMLFIWIFDIIYICTIEEDFTKDKKEYYRVIR